VRLPLWDVVFVVVTVSGGLVGGLVMALTFAQARRARNRPFSNVAAVGVFVISALFSITAVLLVWWYTGWLLPWPLWAG
jgi:ABC-type arginine transport system permease subunit